MNRGDERKGGSAGDRRGRDMKTEEGVKLKGTKVGWGERGCGKN